MIISWRWIVNWRGEVELVISKYCDTTNTWCTNSQKHSKIGNVKGMNKGIKIQDMKHKRNKKKRREMQKEKQGGTRILKKDPGPNFFFPELWGY